MIPGGCGPGTTLLTINSPAAGLAEFDPWQLLFVCAGKFAIKFAKEEGSNDWFRDASLMLCSSSMMTNSLHSCMNNKSWRLLSQSKSKSEQVQVQSPSQESKSSSSQESKSSSSLSPSQESKLSLILSPSQESKFKV